jgi:hypothetical protein
VTVYLSPLRPRGWGISPIPGGRERGFWEALTGKTNTFSRKTMRKTYIRKLSPWVPLGPWVSYPASVTRFLGASLLSRFLEKGLAKGLEGSKRGSHPQSQGWKLTPCRSSVSRSSAHPSSLRTRLGGRRGQCTKMAAANGLMEKGVPRLSRSHGQSIAFRRMRSAEKPRLAGKAKLGGHSEIQGRTAPFLVIGGQAASIDRHGGPPPCLSFNDGPEGCPERPRSPRQR